MRAGNPIKSVSLFDGERSATAEELVVLRVLSV